MSQLVRTQERVEMAITRGDRDEYRIQAEVYNDLLNCNGVGDEFGYDLNYNPVNIILTPKNIQAKQKSLPLLNK